MHGFEQEMADRLRVIWLNVDDEVGRRARAVYGNQKVPTLVLLNAAGSEVHRTEGKLPRRGQIRDKLAQIEAQRA